MKKILVVATVLVGLVAAIAIPASAVICSGVAGDANNDGSVNVGDLVFLNNYIWHGGPPPPCMDQADANGDCSVNLGDFIYLYNYIFKGGPAPKFCGA